MAIRTDWLEKWATISPSRIALKDADTGREVSYGELYSQRNRCSNYLLQHFGVSKSDRVAVLAENALEYVILYFAVMKLGAILVPINYRLTAREISQLLQDSAPALLIYQEKFHDELSRIPRSALAKQIALFEALGSIMDHSSFADTLPDEPAGGVPFASPCMILYTSGTTGAPKGAIYSHEMMFWNSISTQMRLSLTASDATLNFAPFFHTGGWHVLTTPLLHHGAKVVLLSKFDPAKALTLCESEGISILFGVPTMMSLMSREAVFDDVCLDTLRYAIVGGESMPLELIHRWQEKGVPIRQGYGLTEFGPNVFSLNEEDAIRKIGSIGTANFYVDARVVNHEGQDVEKGDIGELILQGPACTPGYWGNEGATAQTIRNGWLHTGDLVRQDEDGYFYVAGRLKDMYISGGENVYPLEIEQHLQTHPKIREVAVVGVTDPKWGGGR